jgi:thiol-disulfide isomerase/thioredoxin
VFLPNSPTLAQALARPELTIVLCFCAAWCDACKAYQPKFEALGQQHPDVCFIWADIEDYPELLGDEDVENFPTIAIVQEAQIRFMGTLLPHIEHLNRLIETMHTPGRPQSTSLPEDLIEQLKTHSQKT